MEKIIIDNLYHNRPLRLYCEYAPTLRTGGGLMVLELNEKRIGNIYGATGGNYAGMVYDKNGIAPTVRTVSGGNG